MPVSVKDAETIAAKKAIELFGLDELRHYDGWNSLQNDVFCLSLGRHRDDDTRLSIPTIDETKPWDEVTDIFVKLENGTITVKNRKNVSIF